uniref:NitT/TauT family transport system ATP-binding protein n=1 Tax=Candidatus Kentrum sp. FW TaxID=2126338 RepID=A0A450SN11_9GAMM|nr:MAG: NitT/TauT family transport system ATP-binding protein [Candidatus Kentron sp. FW]
MPAREATIAVGNLVIRYPTPEGGVLDAVNGVSFQVSGGERIALVGSSGCGKSTILKTLAGLLLPTEGSVRYRGMDVEVARAGNMFGMVPQHVALLPWSTVARNISLPLRLQSQPRHRIEERVGELIRFFGLDGFADYYPGEISGGMRSRVAIARALANSPEILLLDECFGSLDELTRERLNVELSPMWHRLGTTLVFVTHSVREAAFLADRVIVLSSRPAHIEGIVRVHEPQPRTVRFQESDGFRLVVAEIRRLLHL